MKLRVRQNAALVGVPPAAATRLGDEPRTLLVASSGGHLEELVRLAARMSFAGRPLWVTFDAPQSRSLLEGQDVVFVRHTAPRDVANVARNFPTAIELFRTHRIVEVVSTGAAIAMSFIPFARVRGIPCHYVESAARSHAPSVTGRAMGRLPGVTCYTQHRRWANEGWRWSGSVFDEFQTAARMTTPEDRALRVFVALGTQAYRFDRLVDAIRPLESRALELLWQTGPPKYDALGGRSRELMSAVEFRSACEWADVVIGQAGVGTALSALEAGRVPILVPRERARAEHVDDHQHLIAAELLDRNLAVVADGRGLTSDDLLQVAGLTVVHPEVLPAFDLQLATRRSAGAYA